MSHAKNKAQSPRQGQERLAPGLYLIATPIGNLGDMTMRAVDHLSRADVIYAEDTRVTKKLLSHYSIAGGGLQSLNDHNEETRIEAISKHIKDGKSIALVSDAGTPLISDPGYKLVRALKEQGLMVTSLPGASSVLTALQLSAMPTDRFTFAGFIPVKEKAKKDFLKEFHERIETLIFFETGRRLLKTLETLAEVFGSRQICVARELTKLFEETRQGTAADIKAYYEENGTPKGEIVLVIAPADQEKVFSDEEIMALLKKELKTLSVKDAAANIAKDTGLPKKQLYERALQLGKEK